MISKPLRLALNAAPHLLSSPPSRGEQATGPLAGEAPALQHCFALTVRSHATIE